MCLRANCSKYSIRWKGDTFARPPPKWSLSAARAAISTRWCLCLSVSAPQPLENLRCSTGRNITRYHQPLQPPPTPTPTTPKSTTSSSPRTTTNEVSVTWPASILCFRQRAKSTTWNSNYCISQLSPTTTNWEALVARVVTTTAARRKSTGWWGWRRMRRMRARQLMRMCWWCTRMS